MLLLNEVLADSGGFLDADLPKNESIEVCFDIVRRDEFDDQLNFGEFFSTRLLSETARFR